MKALAVYAQISFLCTHKNSPVYSANSEMFTRTTWSCSFSLLINKGVQMRESLCVKLLHQLPWLYSCMFCNKAIIQWHLTSWLPLEQHAELYNESTKAIFWCKASISWSLYCLCCLFLCLGNRKNNVFFSVFLGQTTGNLFNNRKRPSVLTSSKFHSWTIVPHYKDLQIHLHSFILSMKDNEKGH